MDTPVYEVGTGEGQEVDYSVDKRNHRVMTSKLRSGKEIGVGFCQPLKGGSDAFNVIKEDEEVLAKMHSMLEFIIEGDQMLQIAEKVAEDESSQ